MNNWNARIIVCSTTGMRIEGIYRISSSVSSIGSLRDAFHAGTYNRESEPIIHIHKLHKRVLKRGGNIDSAVCAGDVRIC